MHLYRHEVLMLVQENNIYHNNRYYKVSYQDVSLTSSEHHYELSYIEDANSENRNLELGAQLQYD